MLTSFSSTYLNATTSPLLLLPAEIRNMIFEYAMYHETINIHLKYNMQTDIVTSEPRHSEPLLFVCRQIHLEVAILPYKLNVFFINSYGYIGLFDFLQQRAPDQLDLMVKVMCQLGYGRQVHVASAAEWIKWHEEVGKRTY